MKIKKLKLLIMPCLKLYERTAAESLQVKAVIWSVKWGYWQVTIGAGKSEKKKKKK